MLADLFDAVLLDLDGVVYLGDEPLSHARKSLARLHEKDKEIRFLTNDPRPTRDEVAKRLSGMGMQARAEEVVTSGWATAGYLAEAGLHSAYVVGSPGLASEIRDAADNPPASGNTASGLPQKGRSVKTSVVTNR